MWHACSSSHYLASTIGASCTAQWVHHDALNDKDTVCTIVASYNMVPRRYELTVQPSATLQVAKGSNCSLYNDCLAGLGYRGRMNLLQKC